MATIKQYTKDFMQLVFPRICAGCHEQLYNTTACICEKCKAELPYTYDNIADNLLMDKLAALQPIAGVYSMCYYSTGNTVQRLLKELKYRKQARIGKELGQLLGEQLATTTINADLIVPVPLHPKRKAKRGYNQAELIAQGVSNVLQIPVDDFMLVRTKHTKTQTEKQKIERFENVNEIFASGSHRVNNKTVILLDDVITTGATMLSCAEVLFAQGAKAVYLASVAKASQI